MGRDIRICALCAFVSFVAMAVHAATSTFEATAVENGAYDGKTPTITKFRPAANGKLYLTNVSGELAV